MLYRVYNKETKKWEKKNIYLNVDGELFLIKKSLFGAVKIPLELSGDKYVVHKAIDLWDKDEKQVYEGDFIQARVDVDKIVVGLVVFAQELSAYIILCVDSDVFYTLGSNVSEEIQVIGNVFDGY